MDSSTPQQQQIDRVLKLAYEGKARAAWVLAVRLMLDPKVAAHANFWWSAALASEICRWSTPTKVLYPTPRSLRRIGVKCTDYNQLKECGFWSEAASNIFKLGRDPRLAIQMLTWSEELSRNERFKQMVRRQKTIMRDAHKKQLRSVRSAGKGSAT
jgi:hypothetical protein